MLPTLIIMIFMSFTNFRVIVDEPGSSEWRQHVAESIARSIGDYHTSQALDNIEEIIGAGSSRIIMVNEFK